MPRVACPVTEDVSVARCAGRSTLLLLVVFFIPIVGKDDAQELNNEGKDPHGEKGS